MGFAGRNVAYCECSVGRKDPLLPGQTSFEVPEVEIAVHVPEHQGVAFPRDACDATHTALQRGRIAHIQREEK